MPVADPDLAPHNLPLESTARAAAAVDDLVSLHRVIAIVGPVGRDEAQAAARRAQEHLRRTHEKKTYGKWRKEVDTFKKRNR